MVSILAIMLFCITSTEGKRIDMGCLTVGNVNDRRFIEIRHLDAKYSFAAPRTKTEWERRAQFLREQILTSTGLLPMPERTPLNVQIFDRIEKDDYSVEKVYFESFPGFYLTGNLYRPRGKQGPFPAVLNPHGHWQHGRFENSTLCSVPGRCINFAKQGYVAFSYDMVGYNDSFQIDHRSGQLDGEREHLWGISLGGLQLWNSIRAVDFLASLPDVDSSRIACTGASGGGTQTFLLTAVDERVACSAPVNMISSTMQGGCLCENPPLIRLDTNNMEIGALAAPRPMLLVSATGDWTSRTMEVEYPAIRRVYQLYRSDKKIACVQMKADHNYNQESREAVYSWFARWLLGITNPIREKPFQVEKTEDLSVFANKPKPPNALNVEQFIAARIAASKDQIENMRPRDSRGLAAFKKTFGPALKHALNVEYPSPDNIEFEQLGKITGGDYSVTRYVISRKNVGDAIPALYFKRESELPSPPVTLIVHPQGKQALLEDTTPGPLIRRLLKAHHHVLIIDCFNTGEHIGPPASADRLTRYKYYTTYNPTDTSNRVQDILTALVFLNAGTEAKVQLVGIGEAGPWCLLARAFAPNVQRTVIDMNGLDDADDGQFIKQLFVPCLRRAGDFRTAATLIAPGQLLIHNTQGRCPKDWFMDVYKAVNNPSALRILETRISDEMLVSWLD